MTLRVPLQVVPVTADLRGDDPTAPTLAGVDGTRVVLLADPDQATTIAKLIARGAAHAHPDDQVDHHQVNRLVVDLLAAASQAAGNIAAPVDYKLEAVR